MDNLSNRLSGFMSSESETAREKNSLMEYIQSLHPETITQLSQPNEEATQVMEESLTSMLGHLPTEAFGVTITTSREQLGRLLASAMMGGYFLNNAQQRMTLEKSLVEAADQ